MITLNQTAKALVPFTQVPFKGETTVLAVGRVLLYGSAAIAARKNKYAMYTFAAASIISVVSSISPLFHGTESQNQNAALPPQDRK